LAQTGALAGRDAESEVGLGEGFFEIVATCHTTALGNKVFMWRHPETTVEDSEFETVESCRALSGFIDFRCKVDLTNLNQLVF